MATRAAARRRRGRCPTYYPVRTEWIVLFATALLLNLAGLLAFSGRALAQQGANQRAVAVAQVVTDTNAITGAAELTDTYAITSPEGMTGTMDMTDSMAMTETVLIQIGDRTITRADFDRIFLYPCTSRMALCRWTSIYRPYGGGAHRDLSLTHWRHSSKRN